MLYELQKSIMELYNSEYGATLRGLCQGLFEDEAPASISLGTQKGQELVNSVKPFMVFSIVTTGLDQNFCANLYEPLVQFTIYGDADNLSSIDLLNIQKEFLTLYNAVLMDMDNDHTMVSSKVVEQRKFKDTDKMWNVIIEIQYIVQKNR